VDDDAERAAAAQCLVADEVVAAALRLARARGSALDRVLARKHVNEGGFGEVVDRAEERFELVVVRERGDGVALRGHEVLDDPGRPSAAVEVRRDPARLARQLVERRAALDVVARGEARLAVLVEDRGLLLRARVRVLLA
jgi:hypothetical protein